MYVLCSIMLLTTTTTASESKRAKSINRKRVDDDGEIISGNMPKKERDSTGIERSLACVSKHFLVEKCNRKCMSHWL